MALPAKEQAVQMKSLAFDFEWGNTDDLALIYDYDKLTVRQSDKGLGGV